MPKPKYDLTCPLCRTSMKPKFSRSFVCPNCQSMLSLYGGPEKADQIKQLLKERKICPTRSEKWLREKAAIEDRSLLSVGGLVTKAWKPGPRVHASKVDPKTWTVYKFKKGDEEGFQCFCGDFKPFSAYVYAHWDEKTVHSCAKCSAEYAIVRGLIKVTKNPVGKYAK